MHFQYFLPDRQKVTIEELCERGLGYAFAPETSAPVKHDLAPRPVMNGPGGRHGIVVSRSTDFCGYFPAVQSWQPEIGADHWVGMWTEPGKRPTPETLARENMITGQWLLLDDGHHWLLPKARHWEEFEDEIVFRRTLPSRLTRNASGEWFSGEVKERYRELWRLAGELMAAVVEGQDQSFRELDNLVIECFTCNYHVSAIEIDLLGIHDDHVRDRAPRILLDMDNFETLFKKKLTTRAIGGSAAGQPESTPAAATAATSPP